MANTKYTSRNFYTDVMNGNITEQVKEYARESIKKMDEKNANRSSTMTASQKANAQTKSEILAYMVPDEIYTAKGIAEKFAMSSTQRASTLLGQMVVSGDISVKDYTPTGKKKDTVKGYFITVKA
jgi:signal transduction histidine kinase